MSCLRIAGEAQFVAYISPIHFMVEYVDALDSYSAAPKLRL